MLAHFVQVTQKHSRKLSLKGRDRVKAITLHKGKNLVLFSFIHSSLIIMLSSYKATEHEGGIYPEWDASPSFTHIFTQ